MNSCITKFSFKNFLLVGIASTLLSSCAVLTRTETTTYHVTVRDSVIRDDVHNAPGVADNGVVFPTSIERHTHRDLLQYDSIGIRYYPRFVRAGVFEAASFITPGDKSYGVGGGFFGILGMFDSTFMHPSGTPSTFRGGMYRLLTWDGAYQLPELGECTLGSTAVEAFAKDAHVGNSLLGIFPVYVKKRFFLNEEFPAVMVVPYMGVALAPSVYVNIGASLDVGSVGGMNVRGFAGFIAGANPEYIYKANGGLFSRAAAGSTSFPYIGIGMSALDFVNRTEETRHEWRDHHHTATEVTLVQLVPIFSTSKGERFPDPVLREFSGVSMHLASVAYPLGKFVENGFNIGTSLFNVLFLSHTRGAYSVLPLTLSYRRALDSLEVFSATAFLETNYYPAAFLTMGVRMNIGSFEGVNVTGLLGFATGSLSSHSFWKLDPNSFSALYGGVGISLGQIFPLREEAKAGE